MGGCVSLTHAGRGVWDKMVRSGFERTQIHYTTLDLSQKARVVTIQDVEEEFLYVQRARTGRQKRFFSGF